MPTSIFGKEEVCTLATLVSSLCRNDEDREAGMKLLTGWTYRGNEIEVSVCTRALLWPATNA